MGLPTRGSVLPALLVAAAGTIVLGTAVVGAVFAGDASYLGTIGAAVDVVYGGVLLWIVKVWRHVATREDLTALREESQRDHEAFRLEVSHLLSKVGSQATTVILDVEDRLGKRLDRAESRVDELWTRPPHDRRGRS